jgi:hypothetical protein
MRHRVASAILFVATVAALPRAPAETKSPDPARIGDSRGKFRWCGSPHWRRHYRISNLKKPSERRTNCVLINHCQLLSSERRILQVTLDFVVSRLLALSRHSLVRRTCPLQG